MKKRRTKKMAANVKKYLRALKHAKSFPDFDRKKHEAIKRYHKIK